MKAVPFIKTGERPTLHAAHDWQLHIDLGKQLRFPRPDLIVTSETKYQGLVEECRGRGWRTF